MRRNSGKSFLLLFVFLFSCFLQVSVTLKYAELIHAGNSSKVTKGVVYELPDTPENPEKNNCDCFEDNKDELFKDTNFDGQLSYSEKIYGSFCCTIFNCPNANSKRNYGLEDIYLSIHSLKI